MKGTLRGVLQRTLHKHAAGKSYWHLESIAVAAIAMMAYLTAQAGGGCPGAESCCLAHVSTGCDDAICCEAVCSIDPSCCEAQWDELCAAQASDYCASCGASCQPACDLLNVECLDDSGLAGEYSNRRVVAQLRRADGTAYCTAWIIGAPDCMLTAAHCEVLVGDSAVFNLECNGCDGGTLKVTSSFPVSRVLASNAAEGWTLFRVTGNPASQFSLPSIDPSQAVVGQPIYGIHHAGGEVKAYDTGTIVSLNQDPPECFNTILVHAVSIAGTAESHGSPVFRGDNHCVMGLYSCGPPCGDGFTTPMSAIWPTIEAEMLAAGCEAQLCGLEPPCPVADHDCFSVGGAGCDQPQCCQAVCVIDEFCCEVEWDRVCVEEAIQLCPGCGNPGAGSCFIAHALPFCASEACCEAVCAIDPFCCNSIWDSQCAELAVQSCPACNADLFPKSPACGTGDGDVGAGDLAQLLANWGPCGGCCADLAPPGAPDGVVGPGDLAELLAAWGQCF